MFLASSDLYVCRQHLGRFALINLSIDLLHRLVFRHSWLLFACGVVGVLCEFLSEVDISTTVLH